MEPTTTPALPASIAAHFADLPDPRRVQANCDHLLLEIVTLALLAVICGADGWLQIEVWAQGRAAWLRTFLRLPNGIPSDSTFERVFRRLDPRAFQRCFTTWMQALAGATTGKLVAIDGKTLRRSFDTAAGTAALHLVHAWAAENQVLLGQLATEAKSNEITAIPALLDLLDLRGALVTIDAMGCQKDIAATIVAKEADYILTLKDNHPTIHAEVAAYFDRAINTPAVRTVETTDGDHGRLEVRRTHISGEVAWFADRASWAGLRSFVCVERTRTIAGNTSYERCEYLSSLTADDAALPAAAIRAHWAVENGLHWTLDVTFGEDASRIRKDHGPENFALVRRLAVSLLKREPTPRLGVPSKRLRAAVDLDYLLKVLAAGSPTASQEKG